ncbi:hypothetical protein DH2020_028484 [Rehmannia glutinosa]|uniref:AP2/ERF domain-containing protein n=1 Tax=Rehmannia glutinosa TaxID=99300 RepID=A0ABR0VUJ0_REHGL
MLDLNIDFGFSVDSASCEDETDEKAVNTADADSVTSTTTGNVAVSVSTDELDCNSSTRRNSISTLNFSILHENVIGIEDDVNNGVDNNRNELQLFPVDALSSPPWRQQPAKKSRRGPRSRSSQYRGVTFYRRTGRWESHIWDCGKQVYLGGFDTAHAAARAYDRAAVKFRGVDADINFNISDYEEDMRQMNNLTKEEFVQILRRHSNGMPRGSSKYRGINAHKFGQWEARTGQSLGEKVYDKATVVYNQGESLTNFDPSNYKREMITTSTDGGSDRSLDLNLGISLASYGPQRNYTTKALHFPYASNESPDGKTVKVQNSSPSSYGLVMTTKYAPMVGGIYSGFAPNSKERAIAMSGEAIPLPGFSNWPWKMQSHGVPLLSSAASSGFSSLMSLTSKPQFASPAFNNLQ